MALLAGAMSRHRTSALVVALVFVLTCTCGGVLVGRWLSASSRDDGSATAEMGKAEAAGSLRLRATTGWSRLAKPPRVPGFTDARRVVALHSEPQLDLVAGLLPAQHPSLLPAAMVERLGTRPPAATAVPVGNGSSAYQYAGLRVRGVPKAIDVLAWPTASGVATVACLAPAHAAALLASCDEVAGTVTVTGERGLPLGPSAALRARLPTLLASLDAVRRAHERAATRGDAGAADRLATAHRRAGETLSPLAPTPRERQIERALRAEGAAYRQLAEALRGRNRAEAIRAAGLVETGDRRLRRDLECLERDRSGAAACGYQR